MDSPYKLSAGVLEQEIKALQTNMNEVFEQLPQLWTLPPSLKFFFMSSQKHPSLTLESNSRVVNRTGGWFDAVVEPAVLLNMASKISFKINKIGYILAGVCFKNIV